MTNSAAFSESVTGSTNIVALPNPDRQVNLSDPKFHWWEEIEQKLKELNNLPLGWDGYDGKKMEFDVGCFARQMLAQCGNSIKFPPSLVPGPDGDLQIEWHYGEESIEIQILAPYIVQAWRGNEGLGEDGEEITLSSDFTILDQWLKEFGKGSFLNEKTA